MDLKVDYELLEKNIRKFSDSYDLLYFIKDSLEFEENKMFFVCPNGCRYPFDEATDFQFICPRCNEKLEFKDNSDIIDDLKNLESYYTVNK